MFRSEGLEGLNKSDSQNPHPLDWTERFKKIASKIPDLLGMNVEN